MFSLIEILAGCVVVGIVLAYLDIKYMGGYDKG
jgi:type II secretory pathway pseudopilin PulG